MVCGGWVTHLRRRGRGGESGGVATACPGPDCRCQGLAGRGRWAGAYYLAGYAVECGLKACILAYVENTGAIFLNKRFLEGCWTHELEKLLITANLQVEFG